MDLERDERRRVVAVSFARTITAAVILVGVFYLIDFGWDPVAQVGVVIVLAVVFMVGVSVWQLRSVAHADLPELRGFEVLASSSVLLVVLFSSLYLSLSNDDPGAFSEPLDHTGALYFTLTTLTTVGFGDITARSDAARIAVMTQMIASFVVLGVLIKLVIAVARRRMADADE